MAKIKLAMLLFFGWPITYLISECAAVLQIDSTTTLLTTTLLMRRKLAVSSNRGYSLNPWWREFQAVVKLLS
jgi:hypothetical protein